jgi:hypothetical protein
MIRRIFRENGLSIALFSLFILSLAGQSVAGYFSSNEERSQHGLSAQPYAEYLFSSHALEALTENWESEFLQLFAYIALTAVLRQKGSAESRPLEEAPASSPTAKAPGNAPWPVRKGGWVGRIYACSLSLAFLALFLISFGLHLLSGAAEYNEELVHHGGRPIPTLAYLTKSRFWFESLQNWQSEFFSIGMMVVLSIFLRQKGSPESKPVESPHSRTGSD